MTLHGSDPALTYRELVTGRSQPLRAEANGGSVSGSRKAEGAAGGGVDRPLVTMALRSSAPVAQPQAGALRIAADRCQALTRDVCGDMPQARRLVRCGRYPTGNGNPVVKKHDGKAYTSGVQTCSSVWACTWCSYKVRLKRSVEITFAVRAHLEAGGGVLHAVFTAPHRRGEDLESFWRNLSDVWGHVTSGRPWQRFKEEHGLLGYVRSAESTHGGNGWHPHLHVLLFVDRPMSPVENEAAFYSLRQFLRNRWCKRMATKHDRIVSEEHGITVDPVKADDAEGSGSYISKVGYELAMTNTKVGRGDGHRTPFAIAHDAATTGDVEDINLWREWVAASHGKNSISWSEGIRDHFDLGEEKTDEELANEDPGGEPIVEIDRALWRDIAFRKDGTRARFLAAFETYDHPALAITAAVRFLERIGYPATVDETGACPLLAPKPPTQQTKETAHAEHQTH